MQTRGETAIASGYASKYRLCLKTGNRFVVPMAVRGRPRWRPARCAAARWV